MALLWVDSFDHYVTADLLEKYATAFNAPTIGATTGRRSSKGLRLGTLAAALQTIPLSPSGTLAIVGIAYKVDTISTGTNFLRIVSGATAQVSLGVDASGFVRAFRGTNAGTVLGTASIGALSVGVYYYIELKTVVDPAAGSVIVRVNEVEVLNLPAVNTAASGIAGWSGVAFGLGSGPGTVVVHDVDDLYILDGSGPAPLNNLLGDCRVDACYPTAEGASSAWTPLSGTDNALMVDETAPDDDTTYNATSTVGATDTHVTQDAPVAGALLYGVQLVLSAKKSDAGTCSIVPVIRHSSVDYPGTAFNPGTSYAYNVTPYGTNPGTAAAWTEADFNAAQFGYKRTA